MMGILNKNIISPIKGNIFEKYTLIKERIKLADVTYLPPVKPGKIIAVGLNYKNHAEELKMRLPDEPIIFLKPPSSIIAHKETIIYPNASKRVDYEAELAIIIKRKCKNVSFKKASDVILGLTCLNDVTARDIQKLDGQWTRAKSFDTFCPLGPVILEYSPKINLDNIGIKLYLNGKIKQNSNTSDMIFRPFILISYISGIMTLNPGDIIATGTPAGIGPMSPKNKVEVEIDYIGKLTNFVSKK